MISIILAFLTVFFSVLAVYHFFKERMTSTEQTVKLIKTLLFFGVIITLSAAVLTTIVILF